MAGTVVLDAREWEDMIRSIDRKVKDPRPILKAAFNTRGFSDVIKHFGDERGPAGRWPSLQPSTIARRRKGRGAGSPRMLQDTGNLRRNFLPSNVDDRGRQAIVFFNPTPYAATHDEGSPKKNIPQREFMWLSDRAQEDMIKIILDNLVE